MILKVLVILVAVMPSDISGGCAQVKRPKELQDCYDEMNKCDEEQVGELAVETCLNNYYWITTRERWHLKYDNKTIEYFDYLWDKYTNNENVDKEKDTTRNERTSSQKSQIFPRPLTPSTCIRKEIRQLTRDEWANTHHSINRMKRDTRLSPNVYEAIARIHNGEAASAAHGGQAFLGWHSMYMLLFEFALRQYNQSLCLPYWDSRLDAELLDPRESVFFWLIGGAVGPLRHPFENWTYTSGGKSVTVVRNTRGAFARYMLIDYSTYNRLMSAQSTCEMSARSSARDETIIERPHNVLHDYLRGTVVNLVVAAQDIIFFMLHGFIDCIFHRNLRNLPYWLAKRYPGPGKGYRMGHGPSDSMGGLGTRQMNGRRVPIRNSDAYSWHWRKYFKYFPSPTCSNQCRTPENYLQCCNNRCVSKIFNGVVQDGCPRRRRKRQAEKNKTKLIQTTTYGYDQYPVMNDYVLNGVPGSTLWVYVAVLITHVRNHEDSFQAYAVKGNEGYDYSTDIYNPLRYSSLNGTIKSGYAKSLKKCNSSQSGSSFVFVRTDGINYSGHYEDYAVIDNRLPVFRSVVYVAIKKPYKQNTNVIFSAYDACGRICKPFCPSEKAGSKPYVPCNGQLSVDNKRPRFYGNTLGDTIAMYWKFVPNSAPELNRKKYCMNFLCDGLTSFSKRS